MGSVSTNVNFYSNYTNNYNFDTTGYDCGDCWFSVSTGSEIYVYNFPKGMVQAIYPETISDKTSVSWNQTQILNRTGNLWAYSGTGDRTCGFSFDLAADEYTQNKKDNTISNGSVGTSASVARANLRYQSGTDELSASPSFDKIVAGLRKTIYPRYDTDVMYPPLTTFCFGNFKVRGFVQNIDLNWKKPIIENGYSKLNVGINMVQINGAAVSGNYFDSSKALNPFQI